MAPAILLLSAWPTWTLLAIGGLIWLAWAFSASFLLLLAIMASRFRPPAVHRASALRSACIVLPAHDEELLLGPVLDALAEVDYPADRRQIVVIADNCSDSTAAVARSRGVTVLERTDPDHRGKGFALAWALEQLSDDEAGYELFVVLDADSVLSPNFLRRMNECVDLGARVLQGRYDVLNANESWRTRLMACALALAHHVKPLGRLRLGLSDGLKGNGMCFTREVVERVSWRGDSITEDIDYTLRLARAGIRVQYVPDAIVRAQMPTDSGQAAAQRRRWEGGRYALVRTALAELRQATRTRNSVLADRALDLLIPPFVELLAVPVVFAVLAFAWVKSRPLLALPRMAFAGWFGVLVAELLYLGIGLMVAKVPARVASALLLAPVYAVWKLALYAGMAARRSAGGWTRTDRKTFAK